MELKKMTSKKEKVQKSIFKLGTHFRFANHHQEERKKGESAPFLN
jgi:hypothetical protein